MGWSTGDGRKEFIRVAFAAVAMTMSAETVFDYVALAFDLHRGLVLLEETLAFTPSPKEQHSSPPFEVPVRYCKNPFFQWSTHANLIRQC